jgi:hypothetical protein
MTVGAIKVSGFSALDGVFGDPSCMFGFDPRMGEATGPTTGTCQAIPLRRRTFEMVVPAGSMTGSARR